MSGQCFPLAISIILRTHGFVLMFGESVSGRFLNMRRIKMCQKLNCVWITANVLKTVGGGRCWLLLVMFRVSTLAQAGVGGALPDNL